MGKLLKNDLLLTAVLLILFLAVIQTAVAEEDVPPLPMTVKGVALIDGSPAPKGTVVAAYLNGEQVKEYLIDTSSGDYCFWISGTAEDEGKPVTFKVDGKDIEGNLPWESGKLVISLELSEGKTIGSGSSEKSSDSDSSFESLKGTGEPGTLGENSKTKVIESSVTGPNVTVQKSMGLNSEDKNTAKSSEDSSKSNSASGFHIVYAVIGILFLAFGLNREREGRRKP
jgi:hypothetical protein